MRIFVALLSLIGAVLAALNLGSRIPPETLAMIVGVVIGALAAVPFSLVLGILLGRRQPAPAYAPPPDEPLYRSAHPPYPRSDSYSALRDIPPVVIVNPASFPNQRAYAAAQLQAASLHGEARQFRIVGEETSS